jgi:hypothetical protein
MIEAGAPVEPGRWDWLPRWLRPLDRERQGTGRRRLIEVTLLILAGLLLAVATVNDLVDQTHVNHRLIADLRTWRQYTGHDYKNVSTEQDLYGHTTKDIVCGNTTPGPPKERVQLCLQLTGPVIDGRRAAHGGWYLPPKTEDHAAYRYACFGSATPSHYCGRDSTAARENPEAGGSPEAAPGAPEAVPGASPEAGQ